MFWHEDTDNESRRRFLILLHTINVTVKLLKEDYHFPKAIIRVIMSLN